MLSQDLDDAARALHALLPQTQCQRCGYEDCAAYAHAIVHEAAPINQCPPGGQEGLERLAKASGRPAIPINAQFGREQERTVAFIDEDWCIGCTLCIKACPVDCIVGASKQMHTIIESECTGCELCIPACPVDCIEIEIATPGQTGWQAWGVDLASAALQRYENKRQKEQGAAAKKQGERVHELQTKLQALDEHPETVSRIKDADELRKKRQFVEAALLKARQGLPKA